MHGTKHYPYSIFLLNIIFSYLFTKPFYLSVNYEVHWEITKNQNFIRSQSGVNQGKAGSDQSAEGRQAHVGGNTSII